LASLVSPVTRVLGLVPQPPARLVVARESK